MYTCRECDAAINSGSEVCPYCGADLTSSVADVFGEPAPVAKKPTAKRILIACGVLLVTLGAVSWFAVPWHMSGSKSESQARALDAVATVQSALASIRREKELTLLRSKHWETRRESRRRKHNSDITICSTRLANLTRKAAWQATLLQRGREILVFEVTTRTNQACFEPLRRIVPQRCKTRRSSRISRNDGCRSNDSGCLGF